MRFSMLLHVLIENEQHDQQRLVTNYWQNNVLKDMKDDKVNMVWRNRGNSSSTGPVGMVVVAATTVVEAEVS